MKDIGAGIGKIMGLCFAGAVIFYTAYLTYQLSARLVPDNTILQAMTVVLFDIGALVWFTLFITQSKGTGQWAISAIGFLMGLGGAIIMAGGELILGQTLVVVDNMEEIGWILVSTTILAAVVHAFLSYMFHLADPAVWNGIENSQRISKVQAQAYEKGRAEIDRLAAEMGSDLAQSLIYEARAQLQAAALPHLRTGATLESHTEETKHGGLVIPDQPSIGQRIAQAIRPTPPPPTYIPVDPATLEDDPTANPTMPARRRSK